MRKFAVTLVSLLALAAAHPALAKPIKRKICIFDIAGNAGPVMSSMRDWKAAALGWGLDATLVPYTNEDIATEDLKAGVCSAALITGIRGRKFNKFVGTLDSVGGVPSAKHLRILMQVLADPRMAPKMRTKTFEVMGVAPAGAAYIFVDDRSINTLSKAAGKKVAVLSYDKTQAELVAQIGATPVESDITNFSTKFNNGVVDVIAAPLAAYNALELYKGLEPNGGIIDYPLAQITMQMVSRRSEIPEDIAQKSREYFYNHFDDVEKQLKKEIKTVDPKWWVEIPDKDKQQYQQMMHDARQQLQKEGYYSEAMLVLERKVRCKLDPSRAECTSDMAKQ